jgi:hypothetical protein
VGAVDLDRVHACLHGALGRVDEALHEPLDLGYRHLLGRRVPLVPGDGARRPQVVGPTTDVGVGDLVLGRRDVPGPERAGLAAGVGELNANLLALRVNKVGDALQRRDLAVLPQARVLGRDAAVGGDARGLDDGKGGAAEGEGAEMDQMPVGQMAIIGRVHAHGADGEAVLEGHAPELERGEERGHIGARVEGGPGRRGLRRSVEGHSGGTSARRDLFDGHGSG